MINRLTSIVKKINQYHHEHGLKALFTKLRTRSSIAIQTWINKNILKRAKVQDILNQAYPHAVPIQSLKIERSEPRFNLVLDHLKEDEFFSGVGTSLIAAVLFANATNMSLRIISRAKESQPAQFFKFLKLQNLPVPKKVEFFSDYARDISQNSARLETSDQDIYMATSWWTAEAIQNVNFRSSYFHLIQDTPSNFRHSAALKNQKGRFISNQKLEGAAFFPPAFSMHTTSANTFQVKSKYKLFFYSRPSKPENHFYTGLKLLDEALTRGILKANEWEICFAGENTPSLLFSIGLKPKCLGKLAWEDYLTFIKTVDFGICLSDSSHPNYPALDIAAIGGVVLTNSLNHREKSLNIIQTPLENLLEGLVEAVQLVKDSDKRAKNYKNNTIETSWEEAFKESLQYMDANI